MNRAGRRSRRTVVMNQKGGAGKTTTVGQTAHRAVKRGKRVLIVECDPQGNSTLAFTQYKAGAHEARPPCSLADVLDPRTKRPTEEAIVHTHREGLDILPGGFKDLQAVADNLISQMGAERRLSTALEAVDDLYDHILFDTRPASDLITRNAMWAADNAVIVTEALEWSVSGLKLSLETIAEMREYVDKDLPIAGFVVNRFQSKRIDEIKWMEWIRAASAQQGIPILGLPVPFYAELSRLAESGTGIDENPKASPKMAVIGETYDAVLDAITA
ncbi:UNVERIFIED_ORG: sporulation initiation inhibitor protein Soj [Mycobacterium phage Adler]